MGQPAVITALLAALLLRAVVAGWAGENPTRIKFGDYFTEKNTVVDFIRPNFRLTYTEKLKKLRGKPVELVAYMAPIIPYDGSYFMAIKLPFEECPFCSPAFDWAACTTVFMKKGHQARFLGGPIRVVGILEIGHKKDVTGLRSWVRIKDAIVSRYKQ
jgi:hypothetical protein